LSKVILIVTRKLVTSTSEFGPARHTPAFLFLGGHPAVDFANAIVPPPGPDIEFLQTWQDVIAWLREAGLTDGRDLHVAEAGQASALEAIRSLRQEWRSVLDELMAKRAVPLSFLDRLNAILAPDLLADVLATEGKRGFQVCRSPSRLKGEPRALAILARSMAEFLASADFKYLRRCANTRTCVLVFYDTTKNHQRQWCSTATCGNRHKVAEFRRRKRAQQLGR
jgi:predicted RNA-binding Zn ribbon-like protein